jgi:hypothetical protein
MRANQFTILYGFAVRRSPRVGKPTKFKIQNSRTPGRETRERTVD